MNPDQLKELARQAQRACVQEGWLVAVLTVRRTVLEECAKICDEMAKEREDWEDRNAVVALMEAADKIRDIKSLI